MSKELKGSKTEANLNTAFSGECRASVKYTYYASQAKKDGYEQVAVFFKDTSDNESEHAKLWFKLLHGGTIPNTTLNLKDAIRAEHHEWTEMYAEFAKTAREEGFEDIAKVLEGVGEIEKTHEERYDKLLENITSGEVFYRKEENAWQCRNCGHIHIGNAAPETCPVCKHPKAYFEIERKNY